MPIFTFNVSLIRCRLFFCVFQRNPSASTPQARATCYSIGRTTRHKRMPCYLLAATQIVVLVPSFAGLLPGALCVPIFCDMLVPQAISRST